MKCIVWVGLFWVLCACGRGSDLQSIPGVYVAEWKSEFASSHDTLMITQREGSKLFDIERRTRHEYDQRIRSRPPEYKLVHWVGMYDEGVNALYVQRIGRLMVFYANGRGMKMGIVEYQKL